MTEETAQVGTSTGTTAGLAGRDEDRTGKAAEGSGNIDETSVRTKFFRSGEGRIFIVGCSMIGLWLVAIAVLLHRGHGMWSKMLTMGSTTLSLSR
jgi:hypothetical protein